MDLFAPFISGVVLSDGYSSTSTPVRFPSVWSQFQSPAMENENDDDDKTFASPTLHRQRRHLRDINNDSGGGGSPLLNRKTNDTNNVPLSPLCLNQSTRNHHLNKTTKRERTPIALKSTFTWATSDSPPCRGAVGTKRDVNDCKIARNPYPRGSAETTTITTLSSSSSVQNRTSLDNDVGVGLHDIVDDDYYVSTQDAEGPTLVMRTRKRKIDVVEEEVDHRGKSGGKGAVGVGSHVDDFGDVDSVPNSSTSVCSSSSSSHSGGKKRKLNDKKGDSVASFASAVPGKAPGKKKADAAKPKARRKIIPLLSGQQKLSGFFKS